MTHVEKMKGKSAIGTLSTCSLPADISRLSFNRPFLHHFKKIVLPKLSEEGETKGEAKEESQDPNTFSARYTKVCHSLHTQPLNMVRVLQSNISLDLICDRIKFVNMLAILKTIKEDRSLHYIALSSRVRGFVVQEHVNSEKKAREADKVLFSRYMVNLIGESIGQCLKYSTNLTALNLQGIPLNGTGIELLCQGLSYTQTLQHLSLYQCSIGDAGCYQLSRALRNIPTLLTMDLSFGNITSMGASHIADLIKFQELARFDQNWKQSLRYRFVNNDEMKGLRRVTLNDNPDIGDDGLKYIIDILMDDFWIRALDVQNCGITDIGGLLALKMVQTNPEIGVVDLRRNPSLHYTIVAELVKSLRDNMTPEKAEYGWLCTGRKKAVPKSRGGTSAAFNNSAWNSGPGRGSNESERKSIKSIDEARRESIEKVMEWKKLKKQEKLRDSWRRSSGDRQIGSGALSSPAGESPSSCSKPDTPSHRATESTDTSCAQSNEAALNRDIELNEKVKLKPPDNDDNIEFLFNKCVMFSASDDESD